MLIVIAAVAVLAASAFFFTRYLEKQQSAVPEISTYLAPETESAEETENALKATPTPQASEAIAGVSSANEILQRLVQSINDPAISEDHYYDFRKGQLADISLEEFQLYIKLLKEIAGGKVESYSAMTYSERKQITEDMLEHDPQLEKFTENGGFYWLEYKKLTTDLRLPIILSKNEQGQTYLSREWVKSCLELRNFSALYFGAMLEQNYEAAEKLTHSLDTDERILKQKTDELLDFYRDHAAAKEIGVNEIVSLRMDAVTFAIPLNDNPLNLEQAVTASTTTLPTTKKAETDKTAPDEANGESGDAAETLPAETAEEAAEVPADNAESAAGENNEAASPARTSGTSADGKEGKAQEDKRQGEVKNYHYVTIYKRSGNFVAVDGVPSDTWKKEAAVYKEDTRLLTVGEDYTAEELAGLFGVPQSQRRFTFLNPSHEDKPYYRVVFEHVELILSPSEEASDKLRVEAVTLRDGAYTAGEDYKIGQRLRELLHTYLYIDTMGFKYIDAEDNLLRLYLNENLEVKMIKMQSPDFREELLLQERSEETEDSIIPEKKEGSEATGTNASASGVSAGSSAASVGSED